MIWRTGAGYRRDARVWLTVGRRSGLSARLPRQASWRGCLNPGATILRTEPFVIEEGKGGDSLSHPRGSIPGPFWRLLPAGTPSDGSWYFAGVRTVPAFRLDPDPFPGGEGDGEAAAPGDGLASRPPSAFGPGRLRAGSPQPVPERAPRPPGLFGTSPEPKRLLSSAFAWPLKPLSIPSGTGSPGCLSL